jgi:hypothetical protein
MNSTPTNVPEAPTLPQTCARKPWDVKICLQRVELLCSITEPIPDEALYRTSRVSEETGGEGMPVLGVEVLQHLCATS